MARPDAAWNPSGEWDPEAETGKSSERMRLCRLWIRVGDYFNEAELNVLIEALEAYHDVHPRVRAEVVAYLLRNARDARKG